MVGDAKQFQLNLLSIEALRKFIYQIAIMGQLK
jgi:hypothetical protein